jgi:hypothetical protein
MCRGNSIKISDDLLVFDDLCFALDLTDPTICAGDYVPKAIKEVIPQAPYDKDKHTYFTCCPPDYEGEVVQHCHSSSCSSRGGDCIFSKGDALVDPMTCDDGENDVFAFPVIVSEDKTHTVYTCCDAKDASVETFFAASTTDEHTCNNAACIGHDCAYHSIECEQGYFPHYVANHIPGSSFLLYTCCTEDSGFIDAVTGFRNEIGAYLVPPEEECSETRCNAGIDDFSIFSSPSMDACWTQNIMDASICEEGFEAKAVEGVVPDEPYDDTWTYFTCCIPGVTTAVAASRKCFSTSCEGGCSGNGLEPLCNDKRYTDVVPILAGPKFTVYNCCEPDKISPPKIESIDPEPMAEPMSEPEDEPEDELEESAGYSMAPILRALLIVGAVATILGAEFI